jgi:hypothetical protein
LAWASNLLKQHFKESVGYVPSSPDSSYDHVFFSGKTLERYRKTSSAYQNSADYSRCQLNEEMTITLIKTYIGKLTALLYGSNKLTPTELTKFVKFLEDTQNSPEVASKKVSKGFGGFGKSK